MRFKYERREGFDVPVLVVAPSDDKPEFWGRKQYKRVRVHRSGHAPKFKAGVRLDV